MIEGLYDIVMDQINEAADESNGRLVVFDGVEDYFKTVCKLIDELSENVEVGNVYVDTEIDIRKFSIVIMCDELLLVHGRSDNFFDLINMTDSFSFKKEKDDVMSISLNFCKIWGVSHE